MKETYEPQEPQMASANVDNTEKSTKIMKINISFLYIMA